MSSIVHDLVRLLINTCDGFFLCLFSIIVIQKYLSFKRIIFCTISIGMIYWIFYLYFIKNPNLSEIRFIMTILIIVMHILIIKLFFQSSLIKSIISVSIFTFIGMSANFLMNFIFLKITGNNPASVMTSDYNKTSLISLLFYLPIVAIYIISYLLFKSLPVFRKIAIRENKSTVLMSFYVICSLLIIILNTIVFEVMNIEYYFSVIILVLSIAYVSFTVFLLIYFSKTKEKEQTIELQKIETKNMMDIVEKLSSIKHNYDNTLASILGYISINDMTGLEKFVYEAGKKATINKSFYSRALVKIKNPGLLGLLVSKIIQINETGIEFIFEVYEDISSIRMNITDLCECLGILIDNAMEEVAEKSGEHIKMKIYNGPELKVILENTITDKIELHRIFEKGWSTKGNERGLGLWILKNTIRKYKNVILNTVIDGDILRQELIIS